MPHNQYMVDEEEEEHKDVGIIYYPEETEEDPGFTVLSDPPTFSSLSTLTNEDIGTQQRIFDRLPLSQSKRAEFFEWLTTDYIAEQEAEERATTARGDQRKRKRG